MPVSDGGGFRLAFDFQHPGIQEIHFREEAGTNSFQVLAGFVDLPSLASRGDDVLALADLFLKKCATLEGRPNKMLEPAAAQLLLRYSWPGNVRELRRAMESAFVLANGSDIKPNSLPEFLRRDQSQHGAFTLNLDNVDSVNFPELIQSFETQLLQWGLQRGSGSQSKAARALGLPRTTLQSKLGNL